MANVAMPRSTPIVPRSRCGRDCWSGTVVVTLHSTEAYQRWPREAVTDCTTARLRR